jgi:hypothetical protein
VGCQTQSSHVIFGNEVEGVAAGPFIDISDACIEIYTTSVQKHSLEDSAYAQALFCYKFSRSN